ncbi:hypothetical protein [Jiangella sp. DSM 45060]|uniref:hypothetical protein n=1 Tax=Jiangella sp. DSM 45060 TaxID=1798224 RepID=UPI00087D5C38|nr:hypothetical protein [Jiangella sp. DSM 45060]SDT69423.1 hypothetical protein SAMN04515669_6019 [Jiangella sp. DSM 45060]
MSGSLDANGIYIYDETDLAAPFSDLLNLGQESVSDEIANDRARLDALEGRGNASAWTPTFTNASVGNGAVNAYWGRIGDLVAWQWKWVLGSTSTITGTLAVDLPTLVTGASWMTVGSGYVSRGTSGTGRMTLACRMSGSTTINLWMDGNSLQATSPLSGGTWVSGDVISVGGVYFAA